MLADGTHLLLEPAMTGVVALGPLIIGADLGAIVLPKANDAALGAHAQIGVKF
jgi:hypothetical protein